MIFAVVEADVGIVDNIAAHYIVAAGDKVAVCVDPMKAVVDVIEVDRGWDLDAGVEPVDYFPTAGLLGRLIERQS